MMTKNVASELKKTPLYSWIQKAVVFNGKVYVILPDEYGQYNMMSDYEKRDYVEVKPYPELMTERNCQTYKMIFEEPDAFIGRDKNKWAAYYGLDTIYKPHSVIPYTEEEMARMWEDQKQMWLEEEVFEALREKEEWEEM